MRASRVPYCTRDGRFYIRIGSTKQEASREELMDLYHDGRPTEFENVPLVVANLSDVDESLLWTYVRGLRGEEFGRKDDYPTIQVMKDMGLAVNYPASESPDIVPTLGGLLLFGYFARVPEVFPRSSIIAARYSGTTLTDPIIERVEIGGNLSVIFEWDNGVHSSVCRFMADKGGFEVCAERCRKWRCCPARELSRAYCYRGIDECSGSPRLQHP